MPHLLRSAPERNATELVSLCCSLNSPVVSIPELPVGPAFAAIAIHVDREGDSHATVVVRCQRTAELVFFDASSEPGDRDGFCARTALLWAEGMGFLFDEELCDADLTREAREEGEKTNEKGVRNERAIEIWRELIESAEPGSVDLELRVETDASAMLSKFRWQCDIAHNPAFDAERSQGPKGIVAPAHVNGPLEASRRSTQNPHGRSAPWAPETQV